MLAASSAQSPKAPAAAQKPALIAVPQKLADDYARALETEQAALNAALLAQKDYQTAQQQRLKVEAIIASEVGCPASRTKILRDDQGRIIVNKDNRIETIECLSLKTGANP